MRPDNEIDKDLALLAVWDAGSISEWSDDLDDARDRLRQDVEPLLGELVGARATIAHQCDAMGWIAGHDRTGEDHVLGERAACAERDAAEAKIREVEAILTEFVNVRGDFYEPSPLIAMIDRLACTLRIALRTDWRSFAASSDGTG